MYSYSKGLFGPKNFLIKIKRKLKGSLKDPLICLKIVSVLLFFSVCFGSGLFSKSLSDKGDFLIAAASKMFEESNENSLFITPLEKFQPESPELLLVENSSLKGSCPPTTFSPQVLGNLFGGYGSDSDNKAIVEYSVESGDSLWSLADDFGLSLESILWANDLNKYSKIQPGQKLIIPPTDGIIYYVKAGDIISEIAQKYKGESDEIINFNNLSGAADIYAGDIIIIPGGEMPSVTTYVQSSPDLVPIGNSYFICPISSPCTITQGLHWYNAIDFSHGKCGEPIYAAAAGEVLKVKLTNSTSKWAYGGAGNHISILHPNGVVTMYGHIAAALVGPGEKVSQGQIIAYMGGQPGTPGAGMSTGCHVHFDVRGAKNPFAK